MGYRLDIHKLENGQTKNIFYGTKLFGYRDESKFLSYMYLVSIGKLEKDEFFDYGSGQNFALNKKEFTIFCYLYNIDMNKFYEYSDKKDIFINTEEIQKELLDDIDEYDNEIYIIGWC